MNTIRLTPQQQQVLKFITEYKEKEGIAPSRREIQGHFGFKSVTAASNHVRLIEKKGGIQIATGKSRGILDTITPVVPQPSDNDSSHFVDVQVVGSIAAGAPNYERQKDDGCVRVDLESIGLPKGTRVFALRVRGESMTGAGILDRDYIILEFRHARDGEIVAALVDGDTTLKRYVLRGGRPFLKAENPRFKNIIPAQELVIQGVMVALVRKA